MYTDEDLQYKVTEFRGFDDSGAPLVSAINPRNVPFDGKLEKTAFKLSYTPEVQEYIDTLRPVEGKLYVLINALGAGEYYGPNLNWDYFPESEILRGGGYGYETYRDCGVYRNHVNARHGGISFGRVVLAAYNKKMHRVELILEIDRKQAFELGHEDIVNALDNGEHPHVSMGMLVPFDECIDKGCGCRAKTKYDRCEHMRKPLLGNIGPKGLQYCLVNRYFKHHDISFVVVPASSIGITVEKLASLSSAAEHRTKLAEAESQLSPKLASMLKQVPAMASKIPSSRVPLEFSKLQSLSRGGMPDALSASLQSGVPLRPLEYQTISLLSGNRGRLAGQLYNSRCTFGPCSEVAPPIGFSSMSPSPSALAILMEAARHRGIQEHNILTRPDTGVANFTVSIRREPALGVLSKSYNAYILEYLQKIVSSLLPDLQGSRMLYRGVEKTAAYGIGPNSVSELYAIITEHGYDGKGSGFDSYGDFGTRLASELISVAKKSYESNPLTWETVLGS